MKWVGFVHRKFRGGQFEKVKSSCPPPCSEASPSSPALPTKGPWQCTVQTVLIFSPCPRHPSCVPSFQAPLSRAYCYPFSSPCLGPCQCTAQPPTFPPLTSYRYREASQCRENWQISTSLTSAHAPWPPRQGMAYMQAGQGIYAGL